METHQLHQQSNCQKRGKILVVGVSYKSLIADRCRVRFVGRAVSKFVGDQTRVAIVDTILSTRPLVVKLRQVAHRAE